MNIHEQIGASISNAAVEVFSTMLGVGLEPGRDSIENGIEEANDGVVSFIGLAGPWAGTGSLSCSPALACRICSQMLLTESTAVDEDVLDAVAELTNMIIGSVKNDLEPRVGPLGLSLPTVVFGKNFQTRSVGLREWTVVRFEWEGEPMAVKMCLAPAERTLHAHHATAQPYTLQV